MARTVEQIQKELNSTFNAERQVVNKQLGQLPSLFAGQKAGLEAQQQQAFGDILTGAKRRGLKFSGIPLAEQAKYTSTNFLPALAGLEQQRNDSRSALQAALANITQRQGTLAQQIYQQELDRDFQAQQASLSRAAIAAAVPTGGNPWGGTVEGLATGQGGYSRERRPDGGYNFYDPNDRPISAATFAQATGQDFRTLLQGMADKGDKGAAYGLRFIGNDFGYDPRMKIGGGTAIPRQVYEALTWGFRPSTNEYGEVVGGGYAGGYR